MASQWRPVFQQVRFANDLPHHAAVFTDCMLRAHMHSSARAGSLLLLMLLLLLLLLLKCRCCCNSCFLQVKSVAAFLVAQAGVPSQKVSFLINQVCQLPANQGPSLLQRPALLGCACTSSLLEKA
jgi:hypothetical protein